jgi:epoxyqueuosine reductase
MTPARVRRLAHECGFELSGIARAVPSADAARYLDWAGRGLGGAMGYLADRRAQIRNDPRNLLPSARSIICVGKIYNTPHPHTSGDPEHAWISRYAWGEDYHDVLRAGLEELVRRMRDEAEFEHKICVDTAPLLERSYARDAGLGWIGRNTCLIHQYAGSWFFLGELLVSLELEPDTPVPDRCGSCTRCIDACPTRAIVPSAGGGFELDARLCISYLTIERQGDVPSELRPGIGQHVFGCDICQDVCPWNSRAAMTLDSEFQPREVAPPLEKLAALTEQEFRDCFGGGPVTRAKYAGFLRNVAIAMGNSGSPRFREPLERLSRHPNERVAEHARSALERLPQT